MKYLSTLFVPVMALAIGAQVPDVGGKTSPDAKPGVVENQSTVQSSSFSVFNLKAVNTADRDNSITVTWDLHPRFDDVCILGRSDAKIDTPEKAKRSQMVFVASKDGKKEFIDIVPAKGAFYYVILPLEQIVNNRINLISGINYTENPVAVPPPITGSFSSISARLEGNNSVQLEWYATYPESVTYSVYRATEIIHSVEKMKQAVKIGEIRGRRNFRDDSIVVSGLYFYLVVPGTASGIIEEFMPDRNYTIKPVNVADIPGDRVRDQYRVTTLGGNQGNDGFVLSWTYEGSYGSKIFRIFRTPRKAGILREIKDSDIIADVDISAGTFTDAAPPPGTYYYGIMPYLSPENVMEKILPGEDILAQPVTFKGAGGEPVQAGNIDVKLEEVLAQYFHRGRFKRSAREFLRLLESTQSPRDRARVKLYLARTYIELEQYRKALAYVAQQEVLEAYPEEANFWMQLIIRRLNGH